MHTKNSIIVHVEELGVFDKVTIPLTVAMERLAYQVVQLMGAYACHLSTLNGHEYDSSDVEVSDHFNYEYEYSAIDHWSRCGKIMKGSQGICEYFYAALELRLCIERLCFEYMVLAKIRDGGPSKSQLKKYSPRDILESVFENQDALDRHCDFMNTIY